LTPRFRAKAEAAVSFASQRDGEFAMKKAVIVAGALLLGSSAVMADQKLAVDQDNFMRALGKSVYVTMLKMGKGDLPYDQAQVDAALAQLEENVPKIPTVFKDNPKEQVVNATYGASQKIWENKADFDAKVPPVIEAIKGLKGKIKDQASVKAAFETLNDKCGGCHETYRLKLK
jgi:cytochrome c556